VSSRFVLLFAIAKRSVKTVSDEPLSIVFPTPPAEEDPAVELKASSGVSLLFTRRLKGFRG